MTTCVIQDWTDSQVPVKLGQPRDVRYKIYRDGSRLYQEIRNRDNSPIRTLELPADIAMDKSSYEVLLRFVLVSTGSS